MKENKFIDELTPAQIVTELNHYIIGQQEAKKAVAIALRNRTRRKLVSEELQNEIYPKNILMIGNTGIGKTEIARRLAKLANAPFIKVEATKFTEVGYVGRDVESIIRDLMMVAINETREQMMKDVQEEAERRTEEVILNALLPRSPNQKSSRSQDVKDAQGTQGTQGKQGNEGSQDPNSPNQPQQNRSNPGLQISGPGNFNFSIPGFQISTQPVTPESEQAEQTNQGNESTGSAKTGSKDTMEKTREKLRQKLRKGDLEEKNIEIEVQQPEGRDMGVIGFNGPEDLSNIGGMIKNVFENMPFGGRKNRKTVSIKQARKILKDQIAAGLVDQEKVNATAIERTENMGIVFLDEVDKIVSKGEKQGIDVSREGVQRDILPLVEGSVVNTRFGSVKTDHILFIAAGAFHISSPSDIIPELQGRFPIRVELKPLGQEEMEKILKEPRNSLLKQYRALLETEGVTLDFTPKAVKEIARISCEVNQKTHDIGARRLSTVLERLLEDYLFDATAEGNKIKIDDKKVREKLNDIVEDEDLSRYIL